MNASMKVENNLFNPDHGLCLSHAGPLALERFSAVAGNSISYLIFVLRSFSSSF